MYIPKPKKTASGQYRIQLRLNGESIPITADTEKECIRQAQYVKSEARVGKRKPPEAPPQKLPTLTEAIDAYIKSRSSILSPATIRGYRIIQNNRFSEKMELSLSDITPESWQMAVNLEAKKCSAKTLKNAWGFLASVISDATGSPPPKVRLPQVMENERPFLEPEEIRPFIKAVHGTAVEIPALLALSSLRRSEILALKWENIDLDNRLIKVKGAAVIDENHVLQYKEENKNKSSARIVPIMIDELYAALKSANMGSGSIVTCNPNTIWAQINRVCKANGLPSVGVHGLRHSFVSLAYHLGVPEKVVMEIGGWSDYQTMRRIYTHVARSDIKSYTDSLKAFFSTDSAEAKK